MPRIQLARPEAETRLAEFVTDPVASAHAAGLRYVTDTRPGIRRVRDGDNFSYASANGQPVSDAKTLGRIKSLGIPPAYTEVWICLQPNGHLQATGRDARGRKQYRYNPRWRAVRDENKYGRMLAFGEALPGIRAQVEQDLARPGLPREKVLAAVVRLLEATLIRVGNAEYARDNSSFGLTTLQDQHVAIKGATMRFEFRGKSGKNHSITLNDRRLAAIVKRCRDLPGYELFQYLDDSGQHQTIDSSAVNDYLRSVSEQEFSAKDFRTWAGTVLAALTLSEFEPEESVTQKKKNVVKAIETVAQKLGNTPTICRKCYVHPAVIEAYLEGLTVTYAKVDELADTNPSLIALRPEEQAVMEFLRQRLTQAEAAQQAG